MFQEYLAAVVQSLSHVQCFVTPCTAAHQAPLSFTNSQSLIKLISIESVMPSNHLILFHPLLLLPSIFPSIRVFSSELTIHIRWPNYWSFSLNISLSSEYSGLISFRIDGLGLLAVLFYSLCNELLFITRDGRIEICTFIFSCENTKVAISCWTTINRRMLDPTKEIHPTSKGKGPQ